jgi:hypothetical protein
LSTTAFLSALVAVFINTAIHSPWDASGTTLRPSVVKHTKLISVESFRRKAIFVAKDTHVRFLDTTQSGEPKNNEYRQLKSRRFAQENHFDGKPKCRNQNAHAQLFLPSIPFRTDAS